MHSNYLQSSAGWLSNLLWLLSWSHPLFFKHVVKGDSQHQVTFPRCLRRWCLCNYFPLWWTLKSSWGTIWSKQVFPSGDPTSAHMLPFKHLKARLGFLCLTAFHCFFFTDLTKRLLGEDLRPSWRNWRETERAAHHSHLLPLVFLCAWTLWSGCGSFLISSRLSPCILPCPSLPS